MQPPPKPRIVENLLPSPIKSDHRITLPETKIAPENWLLKDKPFLLGNPIFRGYDVLVLGSVSPFLRELPRIILHFPL